MIDYAKWLGMDLETEKDLMWIAREGLKAPLPEHWKPCKAPDTGDIYYFNFQTGESVWDHPCDEYYKNLYATEKANLERRRAAERERPASAAAGARPTTAGIVRPGTAAGIRPVTAGPAGANPLDRQRLGSLAPLGGSLAPLSRPITAARPLGGEPASAMRPDESDSGSEGSRGGFGGIDSPSAAGGSESTNVWKLEEDAADDAAREAYKVKLTTAREAWENEMDKEDAAARRRRELERDKEQLRLDQEEAKIRREMEEKFERLAIELKKAAKRREEEAEVEATALEKEATERKAKAEEMMREAAEKIADAKAKSAAAAALVADAEETRHAKERAVRFLDAEKERITEEEEGKIRAEMEPQIAALRAKLDAEREELKKQIAAAAEETSKAKSRDDGSRVAALMSATEHLTDPKIEEMYATAAEASSVRRIEMAEARAQAAEDAARSRISLAEEAVVKADREAMAAIEASRAQTREAEDRALAMEPYGEDSSGRRRRGGGVGRSSGDASSFASFGSAASDGDSDSDGGFESLRGDDEATIERYDPDENPAIASPGGKMAVSSLRAAVAAGDDDALLARAEEFLKVQKRLAGAKRQALQRASSEWRAAEKALMDPRMDEDLRERRGAMVRAIRAALDVSMSAFTAEMRVTRALQVATRSAAYPTANWAAVFSSTVMADVGWDPSEFDPKAVFARLRPAPGAARAAARERLTADASFKDLQSFQRSSSYVADVDDGSPIGSPGESPTTSPRASSRNSPAAAAFDPRGRVGASREPSAADLPRRAYSTRIGEDPLDRVFGRLKKTVATGAYSSKPHPVFADTSGMSETFLKRTEEWAKAAEKERRLIEDHVEWMSKFQASLEVGAAKFLRPRKMFKPAPPLPAFAPTIPPPGDEPRPPLDVRRAEQRAVDAINALDAQSEAKPVEKPKVEGASD